MNNVDRTDARLLLAMCDAPRASGVQLAGLLRLARNTVHSRLARWEEDGLLEDVDRLVSPRRLGYPLRAFITVVLDQHRLEDVMAEFVEIAEVLQVVGVSGAADLLVEVAARDADDLYRIAGLVLALPGVQRTSVSVAMREAMPYRTRPLIQKIANT